MSGLIRTIYKIKAIVLLLGGDFFVFLVVSFFCERAVIFCDILKISKC